MPIVTALGVDTGINTTALVAHELDGREWVKSVTRPKPESGPAHSAYMIGSVRAAVAEMLHLGGDLTVVATERLFLQGDNACSMSLEWAVIEACVRKLIVQAMSVVDPEEMRLVICRPAPPQLKKFVTGAGNAEKAGMGRYIERHWPQAPMQEDQGEAYALMQFARCRYAIERGEVERGAPGEWCEYQVEVAGRDLWSQAKAGRLHTLTLTGAEALELEDRVSDAYRRPEPVGCEVAAQ